MSTKEFTTAWERLSLTQREAAEWHEGPLLILAGPGSGKTRVLTCRIACLLDTNRDKNFRILGMTFTNKAADEMRNRVVSFVPGQEGRLFLGTFHSFCADVLRQHGTHLDINPNFNIYSRDDDLQPVLNDAVEEAKKVSEVVSDLDKKTLPVIKRLKSLLVFPEDCSEVFQDAKFGQRMAVVYPAYESELSKRNALDFNSLILRAYQLFTKFPAFAKRYRTVYPYICIDEFQDTNEAQYRLIRALTEDQYKNLFIVADDDQIIYQWNGASHKRIDEFRSDYSPQTIQLPTNYRCPPEIVKLANNLISHNLLRTANKKPLEAFRLDSGQDSVRLLPSFPSVEVEVAGVAQDIEQLHAAHLGTVVILARGRKLLEDAKQALHKKGVPAGISQRKDEFKSTPFVWLHAILRLTDNKQNRRHLETVCGTFAQLTQITVDPEDVITQAQGSNLGYLQHWIKLVRQTALDSLAEEVINQIWQDLVQSRDFQAFSKFALDWFNKLVTAQKQIINNLANDVEIFAGYEEERFVWQDLMREITNALGNEITLEAFLQELQMRSKEPMPKQNTITLMTIHGVKGKEFDHVYLIGLVDDELPSFQSKQKGDNSPEMEEERRNCYVAITRTIKTLTLSYAEEYRGWSKQPSRFLFEMGLLNGK
jgi:DNA helicase-2/ATP-dependent DNA helicase PcrA